MCVRREKPEKNRRREVDKKEDMLVVFSELITAPYIITLIQAQKHFFPHADLMLQK